MVPFYPFRFPWETESKLSETGKKCTVQNFSVGYSCRSDGRKACKVKDTA